VPWSRLNTAAMIPNFPVPVVLYAGVAVVYTASAGIILSGNGWTRTNRWFVCACCVTAAWAMSVAWSWEVPFDGLAGWLELARGATWYGLILHLYRRSITVHRQLMPAFITMGLLALLLVSGLPLFDLLANQPMLSLWSAGIAVRLGLAVCNLLLLENLYLNNPDETRWHVNLLCVALGGLFSYDLLICADGLMYHRLSLVLAEGRAPVTALVAPLLVLSAGRNRRWKADISVSREVVFHSATLIVSGLFLLSLAATGELFRHTGSDWGQVAEIALGFAGVLTVAVLTTSASARSRLRATIVDHFFAHRYDYRREWMRCLETLTVPQAHTGLHRRAIHAIAEVVDSPAGALFVRGPEEAAFQWADSWNMPATTQPVPRDHTVIAAFGRGHWIVELDALPMSSPEAKSCFAELSQPWLAIPLSHSGEVIGFVVLAQARAQFKLDREVFDLLRVVGGEVASRIVEQRAAQALLQAAQLREYSQRFAFVIHDIKNLSGQLSMLLTNAEVHADNPAFQRDMLATLRASVEKITRLLARLQPHRQEHSPALPAPRERLQGLVAAARINRGVAIQLEGGSIDTSIAIDPDSFDAAITHLLNNAIEAGGKEPVRVLVSQDASSILIDIVDQGDGMPPEFVRDELFRPFVSTKGSGHGIGAYQARELLRGAGGDLLVLSHPGSGTTMRLLLPCVHTTADSPVAA
jgi:putative PEP-CTERM system histidine kinase